MRLLRRSLLCLAVCVAAFGAVYFVRRRDPLSAFASPSSATLYSLEGGAFRYGRPPEGSERFQSYPVLGKVELGPTEAKEVLAALRYGIANASGEQVGCFWPRHGLRVILAGRTIDYLVCFECEKLLDDGGRETHVSRSPQRVFNEILRKAGVPLSAGMAPDP